MLILASNSPRRRQLLALGGWDFVVLAAQLDESVHPGELPDDYVRRMAESKVRAAQILLLDSQASSSPPEGQAAYPEEARRVIVAADTAVIDPQGQILGKPADAAEAEAMLRSLRGRTHLVYTGLAVSEATHHPAGGDLFSEVVVTSVSMRDYSDAEMMAYIASGDPLDKAGAYAIQHPGFRPVQNLQGCYANVMGLPVCHLARLLGRLGVDPGGDIVQACQDALEYACPLFRLALSRPAL